MSFDIYGQNIRSGYCEVHPDVHEPYPCSLCIFQSHRDHELKSREDAMYEQMAEDQNDAMEFDYACAMADEGDLEQIGYNPT